YAGRGALLDLNGKLPTEDLDQQVLSSGQIDGKQFAIPTGVNAFSMIANPAALEKAKKELPDDKTWTWDEWIALAQEISATGEATGAEYNHNPAWLQIYAAQRGEKFYDGTRIGMSPDTIKSWWAIKQKLIETKGSPDAAKSAEIGATGPAQSLLGTNQGALGMVWSNQLNALTKSSGQEERLLRMPKAEGATSSGMFLQPAMFYAASAKTEKAEAAGKFIDLLGNDPDAASILLSDRGLPTNAKVLDAVRDKLPETDQKTLDFIDEVKSELSPIQEPPKGALQMEDILKRASEEVRFGRGRPAPGRHRESGREPLSTRYAFVGLGHRAQMYVDALLGDWRDTGTIVGLCDVNTTRMAYYTERIGRPVPCYAPDEYGKMLESADAVVVCTVDATHAEYVVAALDAGLDVVVEKPLTVDAESCAAIAEAAERSPGKLVVTFNYRYSPRNSAVKKLIGEGAIGEVTSVHF